MSFRLQFLQTFAILLILLWVFSAFAGNTIIKPDPLRSDRYQITDSKGNKIGTLKRDPMDNRRILITNPKGEPTGYIKPSILPTTSKRYDIFIPPVNHAGSIRQDPLRGDRYQLNGKTIKRDTLRPDRWVVE
jgi:hypothetical protein